MIQWNAMHLEPLEDDGTMSIAAQCSIDGWLWGWRGKGTDVASATEDLVKRIIATPSDVLKRIRAA